MKPSETCKKFGLKGLKELSDLTGKPSQTLIRWHSKDTKFFIILLLGAIKFKTTHNIKETTS